jgi:hypothetical protein
LANALAKAVNVLAAGLANVLAVMIVVEEVRAIVAKSAAK